jgi:TonB family protein
LSQKFLAILFSALYYSLTFWALPMSETLAIAVLFCSALIAVFSLVVARIHRSWAFLVVIVAVFVQLCLSFAQVRRERAREVEARQRESKLQQALEKTENELQQEHDLHESSRNQLSDALALATRQSELLEKLRADIQENRNRTAWSESEREAERLDQLLSEYSQRAQMDQVAAKAIPVDHIHGCETEWLGLEDRKVFLPSLSVPRPVYTPQPSFPSGLQLPKGDHRLGIVEAQGVVMPSGNVCNISLRKSLGAGFDEEALKTISTWRFKPAQMNGKPIPVKLTFQIEFNSYNSGP